MFYFDKKKKLSTTEEFNVVFAIIPK